MSSDGTARCPNCNRSLLFTHYNCTIYGTNYINLNWAYSVEAKTKRQKDRRRASIKIMRNCTRNKEKLRDVSVGRRSAENQTTPSAVGEQRILDIGTSVTRNRAEKGGGGEQMISCTLLEIMMYKWMNMYKLICIYISKCQKLVNLR